MLAHMVEKSSYRVKLDRVAQKYLERFRIFSIATLASTTLASVQKLLSYAPKFWLILPTRQDYVYALAFLAVGFGPLKGSGQRAPKAKCLPPCAAHARPPCALLPLTDGGEHRNLRGCM